jgi:dTDP-4-amino-4,6-dideoxygalactose transaminase
MALGLKPGNAVFTSPFTFVATAEVISLLGATPVFVDIDPRTYNLDPSQLEKAIHALKKGDSSTYPLPKPLSFELSALSSSTPNAERRRPNLIPKGIIAVDLFGLPADYDRIHSIAQEHGLFVVEDAAQSFGAEYQGRKSCALSDIACTSFFPSKPLGAYGDGGMCFTDDAHLAEIMRSIRIHGQGRDKYENIRLGITGRLDTIQAAVLLAKFDIFSEEIELRNQVANRYRELINRHLSLVTPFVPQGMKSVLAGDDQQRQKCIQSLQSASIPFAIYYPKPLHLQTAFSGLGYREGQFPVSEDCARRIFSLPMHPYLCPEDQERIVEELRRSMG